MILPLAALAWGCSCMAGSETIRREKESRQLRPPRNLLEGMWKALRPRQWVKNVLVFMAPISAGGAVVTDPYVLLHVLYAFITFCLASSSIYLINDARDVEADRAHPVKRFRPIASGVLPVRVAYAMGIVLMLADRKSVV